MRSRFERLVEDVARRDGLKIHGPQGRPAPEYEQAVLRAAHENPEEYRKYLDGVSQGREGFSYSEAKRGAEAFLHTVFIRAGHIQKSQPDLTFGDAVGRAFAEDPVFEAVWKKYAPASQPV